MRDIGIAQLLQGFNRERRARAASAVQDRASVWIELWAMILVRWIRVELEHSAGCMYGAGDCSLLGSLLGFTQVHQQHAAAFELGGNLFGSEVLDVLLGLGDHLRCSLSCGLHGQTP